MMVDNQDLPVAAVLSNALDYTLAPIGNTDPATCPAKRVRACVDRVCQDMVDGLLNRQLPSQAASIIDRIVHRGQQNAFLPYPQMNLPNALKLRKFPEYKSDRFAYSGIWIYINAVVANFHKADSYRQEEFATTSFLFERLQGALPKDREFQFAHRALHAEQQPIVGWRGS
jgi:hypothetical protein